MDGLSKLDRFMPGRSRKLAVVIAIVALIALPVSNVLASHQFSDVPTSSPYHNAISAIASAGITGGCGGTKYCPKNVVTREQMAVFLDRLGNLRNEHGPVVDAFTLNGEYIQGFRENFTLTGGAPFECQPSSSDPFPFGSYSVEYQLFDVTEALAQPVIETHEVLVSIQDDPAASDTDYNVCFHRLSGNLSQGVYRTYGIADLGVGSGIFAGAAAQQAKVAQFREAKAH